MVHGQKYAAIKAAIQHFGEHAYSISCWELGEDTIIIC